MTQFIRINVKFLIILSNQNEVIAAKKYLLHRVIVVSAL